MSTCAQATIDQPLCDERADLGHVTTALHTDARPFDFARYSPEA